MAQTLGNTNTSLIKIFVGSGSGTAITCITDASLSITMTPRDVTCHDSGDYNDYLGGQIGWEISGSGLFAFDATNGFDALFTTIKAKAKVAVTWGTGVVGDYKYGGQALLTKLDASASGNNANSQFSFSFMGASEPLKTINA